MSILSKYRPFKLIISVEVGGASGYLSKILTV